MDSLLKTNRSEFTRSKNKNPVIPCTSTASSSNTTQPQSKPVYTVDEINRSLEELGIISNGKLSKVTTNNKKIEQSEAEPLEIQNPRFNKGPLPTAKNIHPKLAYPDVQYERNSFELMNLNCPTISDFKWYKDMFLSRVYQRSDCAVYFWKEKFIAGLPEFFAEKVKENIRENFNGSLPYDLLTYGDLSCYVRKTESKLRLDFKIQNEIRNNPQFRKDIRTFCKQLEIEEIKPPSQKSRVKKSKPYVQNRNFGKSYAQHQDQQPKPKTSKPDKAIRAKKTKTRGNVVCSKCGRVIIRDKTVKPKDQYSSESSESSDSSDSESSDFEWLARQFY